MSVMTIRYLAFWFVLAVIAVANGSLRQFVYGRYFSELAAHQISTVTGILLTGAAGWVMNILWPIESVRQALTIGIAWLAMTIAFEFGFGHYVAGHSWSRLFADYDLFAGRLWLLFLVWIAAMPWVLLRFGSHATGQELP